MVAVDTSADLLMGDPDAPDGNGFPDDDQVTTPQSAYYDDVNDAFAIGAAACRGSVPADLQACEAELSAGDVLPLWTTQRPCLTLVTASACDRVVPRSSRRQDGMSTTQRQTLEAALERSLGREAAVIMMEHLPEAKGEEFARRSDVEALSGRVDALGDRIGVLEVDVGGLKTDVSGLRVDLVRMEERLMAFINSKIDAVRLEFKNDLIAAMQSQTKTMVLALIGTLISMTALAFAFSALRVGP